MKTFIKIQISIVLTIISFHVNGQWEGLNPGAGGQIQDVIMDSNKPGKLYMASDMEGVYVSNDFGKSWALTADELWHNRVFSIATHFGMDNRVYAGSFWGLQYSNNSGESWEDVTISQGYAIGAIAASPLNKNLVLAGVGWKDDYDFEDMFHNMGNNKGTFFISRDGGNKWEKKYFDQDMTTDWNVWTITFDLTNENIIYIGAAKGIFKSNDAGETWVKVNGPEKTFKGRGAALSPDGKVLYAAFEKTVKGDTSSIYVSNTITNKWVEINGKGYSPLSKKINPWFPEVDPASTSNQHKLLIPLMSEREGLSEATLKWENNELVNYEWKSVLFGEIGYEGGWEHAAPVPRYAHYNPLSWKERGIWTTLCQSIVYGKEDTNNSLFGFDWQNRYCVPNPEITLNHAGRTYTTYSTTGIASTYTYDVAVSKNYVIQAQGDNGPVESWDGGKSWTFLHRYIDGVICSDIQAVVLANYGTTKVIVAQGSQGWGGGAWEGRLLVKKLENYSPKDQFELIAAGNNNLRGVPNNVIEEIAIDPNDSSSIFFSVRNHGIFHIQNLKSFMDDPNKSSAPKITDLNDPDLIGITQILDISVDPINSSIIYFTSNSGNNTGLFRGQLKSGKWKFTKIYSNSSWDGKLTAINENGKSVLIFSGAKLDPNSKDVSMVMSLDQGKKWQPIFDKNLAMTLRKNKWYPAISKEYKFELTGSQVYKNLIVVSYYDHRFQKGYGVYLGTYSNGKVKWEDWTNDVQYKGFTDAIIAEYNGRIYYYTGTKGMGIWRREIKKSNSDMGKIE